MRVKGCERKSVKLEAHEIHLQYTMQNEILRKLYILFNVFTILRFAFESMNINRQVFTRRIKEKERRRMRKSENENRRNLVDVNGI